MEADEAMNVHCHHFTIRATQFGPLPKFRSCGQGGYRADALSTYMTSYERSPDYVVGLRPTNKAGDILVLNDHDI